MGKKFLALSMLAVAFAACSDNEGEGTNVPMAVEEAFNEKYPNSTDVAWAKKGVYYVASFNNGGTKAVSTENAAWFGESGEWHMSDQDISFNSLPQAVKDALTNSEYNGWSVEEVDLIERKDIDKVYVIEVEKNDMDADVYISENGVIVKEIKESDEDEDYEDLIPGDLTDGIQSTINAKYPNAYIVDIDDEDNHIEVEIVDGDVKREVLFTNNSEWISTITEIEYSDLTAAAQAAFEGSSYASYEIDDIDEYVTASNGSYYILEVDTDNDDEDIKIPFDGSSVTVAPDNDDDVESATPAEIAAFITNRYSGAQIEDSENKDGYLVVKFKHENIEKKARFNGKNEWVDTKWDIDKDDLPEYVTTAVTTNHAGYEIDDVEMVDTEAKKYYSLELENDQTDDEITYDVTVQ